MGDWPRIIYDKLPMFYGQLMMQKYLDNPAIAFAAFGDATCSAAPLQVTPFAQRGDIDNWIKKLWLEGGGGPEPESYSMTSLFWANNTEFSDCSKPYFFITADAPYRDEVPVDHIRRHIDSGWERGAMSATDVYKLLQEKYHAFCLFRGAVGSPNHQRWVKALGGEHVLVLNEAKACVDVMLGAISIVAGARGMAEYMVDLDQRGQSEERKAAVQSTLGALAAKAPAPAAAASEEERLKAELEAAKKELAELKAS